MRDILSATCIICPVHKGMLKPIIISYKLTSCQLLILYKYLQTPRILLSIIMLYKEQKVTKRDFKGNDNYKFKFPKSMKIICARYFCVQRANGKCCMAFFFCWGVYSLSIEPFLSTLKDDCLIPIHQYWPTWGRQKFLYKGRHNLKELF